MNLPADLTYDFPWAVWGFFATLLLFSLSALIYSFRKRLQKVFNPDLLLPHAPALFWAKAAALALAWTFATIALMGPKGNGHYPEDEGGAKNKLHEGVAKRKAHDVVIAIDASASMGVKDSRNGTTRLEYAKQIADQLISRLQGDSVALYAFTYEPALLSPATLDTLYVRLLLRSLRINEGDTAGTSLTHMLEAFQKKFLAKPSQKLITLVLLSDGEDNQLKGVDQLQQYIKGPSLLQAQLFTIGMGTEQGGSVPNFQAQSRLQDLPLKFIAQSGHGRYFKANDYTPISLVDDLLQEMDKINPYVQPGEIPVSFLAGEDNLIYDLYFRIPLGLALLFLAFYLLGPNTWKRVSVFLLFLPLAGHAIEEKRVQEAKAAIEAGLYGKGEQITEGLLSEPLKIWQAAILNYNWGTGELLKGDPQKTLEIYEKLPLSAHPSPLLLRNLRTNRALAFYLLALKAAIPEEALYDLTEAHAYVHLAAEAHCRLAQLEGSGLCELPEDLLQLGNGIKLKRAQLFEAYLKERIERMQPQESLPLLYAELEQIGRGLELVKANPAYRQLLLNNVEEWRPVWEKLPADSPIRALFPEFLRKMERGEQIDVTVSELDKALQDGMADLFKNDPAAGKEHVLQGLYQFALLQDPPLGVTLKALEKVEGGENPYLKAAIAAQEKGEGELSRFYLLAAQNLPTGQGEGVKALLAQAVHLQERALRLNRFLKRVPGVPDASMEEIVKKAQEKALEAGKPFLAAAYEEQMDKFTDPKLPLEKRCQAQPWNEVVALYNKGREHAGKALALSLNEQGQAVAYWKEALRHLDNGGGGKGCPSGGASDEMKNIQEMDQDDRIEKKTSAVQVEGVNPW